MRLLTRPLNQRGMLHHVLPLFVVVLFAVVGVGYIVYTHAAAPNGSVQLLSAVGSNICLDDYHSSGANGSKVDIWHCNKTKAQSWTVNATASAGGTVVNSNGLCLDVAGSKTLDYTKVDLYKCNGTNAQKWTYKSGVFYSALGSNSKPICLDDYHSKSTNGNQVDIFHCNGTNAQKWTAQAISSSVGSGSSGSSGVGSGSGTTSGKGSGTGSTSSTGCAPAKTATMTNTVSSKCGFPDTTNTGAKGTLTTLTSTSKPSANTGSGWSIGNGTINVSAGGTLKNVNTNGRDVAVNGANATVDNVKIVVADTDAAGVQLRNADNAVIENSTIAGTNGGSGRMLAGVKDYESGTVYSANINIKANNIYYTSTGIQVDDGMVQDNYVHDMGFINGDHLNGFTSNGGTILLTVQHNTFFNQVDQTDAISLFEDFGVQKNRVINDNLMAGGGYSLYGGQNSGGPAVANIKVTNNHFSTMFYKTYGYWGYHGTNEKYGSNGNVWSGNVDDATGKALGP